MELSSTTVILPLLLMTVPLPSASIPCAPPLTYKSPCCLTMASSPIIFDPVEFAPSTVMSPLISTRASSPVITLPVPPFAISTSPTVSSVVRSPLTITAAPPSTSVSPLLVMVISSPVRIPTTEPSPIAVVLPSLFRVMSLPSTFITTPPFSAMLPPWSVIVASLIWKCSPVVPSAVVSDSMIISIFPASS